MTPDRTGVGGLIVVLLCVAAVIGAVAWFAWWLARNTPDDLDPPERLR